MNPSPTQSRRDAGITALVEGFFAAAWFGWGHAPPPPALDGWLTVGSLVALVVAAAGAVVGFTSPASTAALRDPTAWRRYRVIVGVEFGLAGVGAAVLGLTGGADYIPVWICAVVGVHFFALAPVLGDRRLVALGGLMCVVAAAALVVGVFSAVAPGTVTGVGAGLSLLLFGGIALVLGLRQPRTTA